MDACSSLMDVTTILIHYLEAIKGNSRIDHLADPSGVTTPARVLIVLCQTVLIWGPILRHVESRTTGPTGSNASPEKDTHLDGDESIRFSRAGFPNMVVGVERQGSR